MKKILIMLGLALVLVLAACSGDSDDTNASGDATEDTTQDENAVDEKAYNAALLKNHIEVANTVRNQYGVVSSYVAALADEETEAEALEALKAEALTAAEEALTALDSFAVVQEDALTDEAKTAFEEAVAEVKGSLEAYKEAIEADETDFSAAEEKLAGYSEKITPLYEAAGLSSSPDLASELR